MESEGKTVTMPGGGRNDAPLQVFTLGHFALVREGEPLFLKGASKRLQLLKTLVALGGDSVSITTLTDALWPDADGDQAGKNLHTTLYRLRADLRLDPIAVQGGRLSLIGERCWVDLHEFTAVLEQAAEAAQRDSPDAALAGMGRVLALYRGPFLEGEFEPAEILACRSRVHTFFIDRLGRIGRGLEAAGRYEEAAGVYQQGLAVDDVSEDLTLHLMRCCLETGGISKGMAAYEACKTALRTKFDVEPSQEIEVLRQALHEAGKQRVQPAQPLAPPAPARDAVPPAKRLAAVLRADLESESGAPDPDNPDLPDAVRHHRAVGATFVDWHGGRVVKTGEYSMLAEFPNVVEAVKAALAGQQEIAKHNATREKGEVFWVKIGLHLGEVWQEERRLAGEGVELATWLASLAGAGAICVSGSVADQVRGKLPISFTPVKHEDPEETLPAVYQVRMGPPARTGLRRFALASAALLVLLMALWGGWRITGHYSDLWRGAPAGGSAYPALPDKPSLVVLPFKNLSAKPEHELISDGLTINLIAQLSRLSGLFVISSYTAFAYKDKNVPPRQLGRELGVRHLLNGTVQISGGQFHVTAELIETETERLVGEGMPDHDGGLSELFTLQDGIIGQIVSALQVELAEGEQGRLWARHTSSLEAMTRFWQGMYLIRQVTPTTNRQAIAVLNRALEQDPDSTSLLAALAFAYILDAKYGWSDSPGASMENAAGLAKKVIAIDPEFPDAYSVLGAVALATRDYEGAIAFGKRAVELSPSGAEVNAALGMIFNYAGRPAEAVAKEREAMRLSPHHPVWYAYQLGLAHYQLGNFSEAIAQFENVLQRDPESPFTRIMLTASYVGAKRLKQARAAARIFRERNPDMKLEEDLAKAESFRDPAVIAGILKKLARAGLQ